MELPVVPYMVIMRMAVQDDDRQLAQLQCQSLQVADAHPCIEQQRPRT
jgi:hypothetical protein